VTAVIHQDDPPTQWSSALPDFEPSPPPDQQASPVSVGHHPRWARLREAVSTRTQLLVTTAYLAATSVVGVEVVAVLLGMSALLPVAIPVFLVSITLIALVRAGLRTAWARRHRHLKRRPDSPDRI